MPVLQAAIDTASATLAKPVETRGEAIRALRRVAPLLPIVSAALCGSFAREEQTPESDIDLMVRFVPGSRLSDVEDVREVLEREAGREVDIITSLAGRPSSFVRSVLRGAVRIYG
ncbi:nucleotidyltransferase family protein [uncultured Enorma sp.]|uniref:nucleotidyltransferase family protein n=1 Tax=uncultured Enorma sp. TaxID=1714346 RepID=UPI0025935C37|nr:nucleotidyltransferase domain-containing protein [uncultured Enorma sp.]